MTPLRPAGFDELGLRRALSDRMLPLLVAAMAFLAALALAGWFGTASLSRHWQQGAGDSLTVQVPQATEPSARANQTRLSAVLTVLGDTPGVTSAHALSEQEINDLLKPWLGQGTDQLAISIPAVVAVRFTNASADQDRMSRRLNEAAPGTLVEDHGLWVRRVAMLVQSLQACAAVALAMVAGVAAAVIAVATRAGLATRREAIEIVHGLGATDRYIAGRFARRATLLAAVGAAAGALAALPILLMLANMAAPFVSKTGAPNYTVAGALSAFPAPLWMALPCLPLVAAAVGCTTAHWAVRLWLRRLP